MTGFEAHMDGSIEAGEVFTEFDELQSLTVMLQDQGLDPQLLLTGRGGYYQFNITIEGHIKVLHVYLKKITFGGRENRPYEKKVQFSAALDRMGFDLRDMENELTLLLGIYKPDPGAEELLCAWNIEEWGINIGRAFNCYVDVRALAKAYATGIVRYRTSIGQVAYCFKESWLRFYLQSTALTDRGQGLPAELQNEQHTYDASGVLQEVPKYEHLTPLVFEALKELGQLSVDAMESVIATRLELSEEARSLPHNQKEGNRTELGYRLAWARNYLKRTGLIDSPKRSLWRLTEAGKRTSFLESTEVVRLIKSASEENQRDIEVDYLYEIQTDGNNTDVEYEDLESGDYTIENPFDPGKVDIKTRTMSMDLILKRLDREEIDMNTSFQRKANLWDLTKQSRLIESILIRFPLPAFYFDGSDDDNWLVVDGLQRLSALNSFVVRQTFALQNLEFLSQFNGFRFTDLPGNLQRRIEEFEITTYNISPGTPRQLKFIVFKRINTGGLILTSQEIRNALNQGVPADFIKRLAELRSFKKATSFSIKDDRMLDREFTTRFFSFYVLPLDRYRSDLDSFLNMGMEAIYSMGKKDLDEVMDRFDKAMLAAIKIFGEDAFRKRYRIRDRRKPINKALFEVWSVAISRLNDEAIHLLVRNRLKLKEAFMHLLNNSEEFNAAISSGTGDRRKVVRRFTDIHHIIDQTLSTAHDQ